MSRYKSLAFLTRTVLGNLGLCELPSLDVATLRSLVSGPRKDPNPFLDRVRENEPVCWLPQIDAWLITRHAHIRELLLDARLTSDPRAHRRYTAPRDSSAANWLTDMPFRATPSDPKSTGRRLVSSAMTPRAVESAKDRIREVVEEAASRLRHRSGVVDLIQEFTSPIAATVIGRIAGVPPKGDDEVRFQRLARNATRAIRPFLSRRKRVETERACADMCEYVSSLVRDRIESPRADLISEMLLASDPKDPRTVRSIAAVVSGLVSAGTGTSGTACARALRTLFHHEDSMRRLRKDESLVPRAVDELLRYDSGLLVMPRYVLQPFHFGGKPLTKGQLVVLCLHSGNRDPRAFAKPDVLDFDRDTSSSLSFSHGGHYCIGANLARATLVDMLSAALELLPESARLLDDRVRWSSRGMMSQIQTLPVDFG